MRGVWGREEWYGRLITGEQRKGWCTARDHPKGRTDETTMNPIIRISDITPLVNLWRRVGGKTLLRERWGPGREKGEIGNRGERGPLVTSADRIAMLPRLTIHPKEETNGIQRPDCSYRSKWKRAGTCLLRPYWYSWFEEKRKRKRERAWRANLRMRSGPEQRDGIWRGGREEVRLGGPWQREKGGGRRGRSCCWPTILLILISTNKAFTLSLRRSLICPD